ncbi:MAG: hypothetical protein Q7W02_25420 [Candidatus Rokubacteria bacterium]|nr:hypothetical protein [Candidatus Rokubacteria bacterium]
MTMKIAWAALAGALVLALAALASAADPVGVLTEIRAERGRVEVKRAGEPEWKAAQPLLALRPGDQIRATGEARASLVFTGGRGAQPVSVANSPFTVQAPTAAGASDKVRGLVGGVTDFLAGKQKDLAYLPLSVRSVRPPRLAQLQPRETKLLPGAVTFEWSGSDTLRYKIRVLGPQGILWEQANLPRKPVVYPASAPALEPGVRYFWQLETEGQPMQQAEFQILPAAEAKRVRESLDILVPASLPGYPPSSVALMRAGYVLRDGLYADARRELLTALAGDPDEPTLHLLLGQVYDAIGLGELAQREFIEARDLSGRR